MKDHNFAQKQDQQNSTPYNNKVILLYIIAVAGTLIANEPNMSIIEIIASTTIMVVWTLIAGFGIFFTVVKAVLYVFAKDSAIDTITTKYMQWIAPSIGFTLLICTL